MSRVQRRESLAQDGDEAGRGGDWSRIAILAGPADGSTTCPADEI